MKTLRIGTHIAFRYNGYPREGIVAEPRWGGNTPTPPAQGVRPTGWLVLTVDGYRHYKMDKMDSIQIVR